MRERHRPFFYFNHYQDVLCVSFLLCVENGTKRGPNVRNKLVTITLAVIFMIKILATSQLYRLPKLGLFSVLKRMILHLYLIFRVTNLFLCA